MGPGQGQARRRERAESGKVPQKMRFEECRGCPSHPEKEGPLVSWKACAELQSGGMKGLAYWELTASSVAEGETGVDWAR